MTKKVTKKAGQPTKLTDEVKRQCEILYKKGFTDKEVANVLGVTEQTINNWKDARPQFFESIKDWRVEADAKIELSLRDQCLGFERTIETEEFNMHTGKVAKVKRNQYYRADTRAIKYWLGNRKTASWSDKQEVTVDLSKMPDKALLNLIKPHLGNLDGNEDETSD